MNPSKSTRSASRSCNVLNDNSVMDKDQFNKLNPNEKIIVSLLSEKIDNMKQYFESELIKRDMKISRLEAEVLESKKNYEKLEIRFDDLESTGRANTLVISGGDVPAANTQENCSEIASNLIRNKLKYSLGNQVICSAYRLGKLPHSQKPDKRNILVRLDNEELAQDIIKTSKKVKPTNMYFSENLTPKRFAILQILRRIKRNHPEKICGTSSIRGKVYAWIPPPRPDAKDARAGRKLVNTRSQLEDLCSSVVGISLDEVLQDNELNI